MHIDRYVTINVFFPKIQNGVKLSQIELKIDFKSPMPYWSQLHDILVTSIKSKLNPGDKLPTNAQLCEQYGVSRTTVQQALDGLEQGGLICRRKGSGTFVARPSISEGHQWSLSSFSPHHESDTKVQYSIVRQQQVVDSNEQICEQMRLNNPGQIVYIERVRMIEEKPLFISQYYLPYDLVKGLEYVDLRDASLYQTLTDKFEYKIDTATRNITAVPADKWTADALSISEGDVVLVVKSHSYPPSGELIEFFKAYHQADKMGFNVVLHQQT